MDTNKVYDIIGIGIGPFNLGLAALTHPIKELACVFIDKNENFNWHPGMMLPTAKMQVPYYADLVTLVDPTSPFTYMNYLQKTGKLFRFAIAENSYPYRREYNEYCQWVVAQLNTLYFGYKCQQIFYDDDQQLYYVQSSSTKDQTTTILTARHIVIGIGSSPYIPPCAQAMHHPCIFHSSEYLHKKNITLMKKRITIIGSGQTAAEIFQDLLGHISDLEQLHWYTSSDRFYPMDYSKFALEMSTPEYIRHFYSLDPETKRRVLLTQDNLYKGINQSLIQEIYQQLYLTSLDNEAILPKLFPNTELQKIDIDENGGIKLDFLHMETGSNITEETDAVILATGYAQTIPSFTQSVKEIINWTTDGIIE